MYLRKGISIMNKHLEKENKFIESMNGRFCKYFGSQTKDLNGINLQINLFLQQHPKCRLVTMCSAIGPLGASVLCYFETECNKSSLAFTTSHTPTIDLEAINELDFQYNEGEITSDVENKTMQETMYDTAISLEDGTPTKEEIELIIELFESLGEYKDASQRAAKWREKLT